MDETSGRRDRSDEAAEEMSAAQQAALGDGVVGGVDGRGTAPGDRPGQTRGAEGSDRYDGREEDHSGLVGGGPVDETDAAGGSRTGAGEVEADRARAAGADAPLDESGLAPGESD